MTFKMSRANVGPVKVLARKRTADHVSGAVGKAMTESKFGIGYGKYWDTTVEDDEFDLWVSVFWDGSFGHLVLHHETIDLIWLEDSA